MMATVTALVTACLVGAASDVFQAEVGAQAGARSIVTGTDRTVDVELVPRIALGVSTSDGNVRLATAYDPLLLQTEDPQGVVQLLHQGMFRADVQASKAWRFTTSLDGSYGTSDPMFALRGGPVGIFNVVPTNIPLKTASGDLDLTLEGQLGPRTSTRSAAAVFGSGGADQAARSVFPALFGVQAETALVWKATRRDDLSGKLFGTGMSITPDGRAAFGIASGSWRHQVNRTYAVWAGAGAGVSWSRPRGLSSETGPTFSAEVGLAHAPRPREPAAEAEPRPPYAPEGSAAAPRNEPRPTKADEKQAEEPVQEQELGGEPVPAERAIDRLSEEIVARVTPSVDRSSGAIGEEVEATALGQWRVSESLSLTARATGGVLLLQSDGSPLIGHVELRATWTFASESSIAWGLAGDWQRATINGPGSPPSLAEYGAFVAVAYGIGHL
jgi:hypothetical protein